jgi:putative ABC transport system ATP-binding protein
LIRLNNLSKQFITNDVQTDILKNISFDVSSGEFISIMGPSGSGKSTLMYILGCLDKSTSGRYLLDNIDISTLDDNELSKIRGKYIGFVFQAFYLVPYLNVLENVILPAQYSKIDNPTKKAKEILINLGLEERINYYPQNLSGGQKQRVAIARALINEPKIILADEPTGQLDSSSSDMVMDIFEKLNNQGKTIIIVTHDPKTASYTKRRINLIDGQLSK